MNDNSAALRLLLDELPELPTGVRRWHAQTQLGSLEISLNSRGVWTVLLEEFSRSSNPSLRAALGEATGRHHQHPLLAVIAAALEAELQAPAAQMPGARHR